MYFGWLLLHSSLRIVFWCISVVINPRRLCAASVTVLGLCICVCVCVSCLRLFSASEQHEKLQYYKPSKIKQQILLKRPRSESRAALPWTRLRDPLAAMCEHACTTRSCTCRAPPPNCLLPSRPLPGSAPRDGRVSCAALSRPACN